ncbi:AraC family transcriptional regulator [Paenibacillus sp. GCM10012303]|uniref:AraC family transcriptional regulator n=1 Tax=Paenibacillus sp. GCM10012303 TaxID=3317340 RepID=UPI00360B9EAB
MDQSVLLCGYGYHLKQQFRGSKNAPVRNYLFRLQTEGTCTISVNGDKMTIVSGDLLLLQPGSMYYLQTEEGLGSGDYYMYCQGAWVDEWWNRYEKNIKTSIQIGGSVLYPWRQIIKEKSRLSDENSELIESLLKVLCLSLDRAMTDSFASYSRSYTAFRMKRYIELIAYEPFKVEQVAKHVNLSVSRASHFFKECYGKTIVEYALEVRLSGALDRIKHTSMTMEQIAGCCGFGSYTYFHKAFKEKFGMPPTVFRKMENTLR